MMFDGLQFLLGPLPSMTPFLEDKTKPNGEVKTANIPPGNTIVSSAAASYKTAADAVVPAAKSTKQNAPANVTAQVAKSPIAILAKNTAAAAMTSTKQKVGGKLQNQLTPMQAITKGAHAKGGFVHTLTANDGTKAQVYLSKNGAHAGIVFRNEISRGMFVVKVIECGSQRDNLT